MWRVLGTFKIREAKMADQIPNSSSIQDTRIFPAEEQPFSNSLPFYKTSKFEFLSKFRLY